MKYNSQPSNGPISETRMISWDSGLPRGRVVTGRDSAVLGLGGSWSWIYRMSNTLKKWVSAICSGIWKDTSWFKVNFLEARKHVHKQEKLGIAGTCFQWRRMWSCATNLTKSWKNICLLSTLKVKKTNQCLSNQLESRNANVGGILIFLIIHATYRRNAGTCH